jgi:transcription elongation factor GreA
MSNFLTQDGLDQLQARRDEISNNLIPAITIDINIARDQGDLKENAGFQTALKVRDELVAELAQLEEVLFGDYQIVDSKKSSSNAVYLGSTVTIEFVATKEKKTFRIVGTSESNVLENKISNISPIAEAILDKAKGAVCEFKTPKGVEKIKILEIK